MEGFISTAPHQGIIVRDLSLREIREHYEIRLALETYIIQQISGQVSKQQIIQLIQNLHIQRSCIESGNTKGHVEADADLHLSMATYLGNQEIIKVMQHQRDKMFRVVNQLSRQNPLCLQSSLLEHNKILEAVKNGQDSLAVEHIREHFEDGKRLLLT